MRLPAALVRAADSSARPEAVRVTLDQLAQERPEQVGEMVSGRELSRFGRAFIAVVGASRSLTTLCLADREALEVLGDLSAPVEIDDSDAQSIARSKHLELLRIAALDLLGEKQLEWVGSQLSKLAEDVVEGALRLLGVGERFAVIGMGKLGGTELNYASDVDVVFVAEREHDDDTARRLLNLLRSSFRVDANLRPDGRAGPLTRTLDSYRTYWSTRAAAWELQALIKARHVAGDETTGRGFDEAAASAVWGRSYNADELAEVRRLKARSEELVARRGLASREIKRGTGGIRDVEFSLQLLQLVHGRADPQIRARSTLGALRELSEAGYIGAGDASALERAYRFLRTVEHRLQLVDEQQTHEIPVDPRGHQHLARVMGYRDEATTTASASFDKALRRFRREAREVHERLFFRPLLEAFASTSHLVTFAGQPGSGTEPYAMDPDAVAARLNAFGFADARRTQSAVEELAGGLTRTSRLMGQLLPLIMDWLSLTPDPDLGLLGLRDLVVRDHHSALMVRTFRESPEAARRLCTVLGSSRILTEALRHEPELIPALARDEALAPQSRDALVAEARLRVRRAEADRQSRSAILRLRRTETLKIATRDLIAIDDVSQVGMDLSTLAEGILEAALDAVSPPLPFCVIGMGRLGGGELSYASDLDLLFVFDDAADRDSEQQQNSKGEGAAEELLRFLQGALPAERIYDVDLKLRPEGSQGRIARGISAYGNYLSRWAQTWERQALLRARPVAGDPGLCDRFMAMVQSYLWDRAFTDENATEIRRMKARIERERIPAREDPEFHLKLGRGSLSDVEWTVQLLQLRHGVQETGTMRAIEELVAREALDPQDAAVLGESYRFCEHARNRWYLVGALAGGEPPGDALPAQADQISHLARSLDTTPAALRDEYRRVTRRARVVVERLFYGIGSRQRDGRPAGR